MRATLKNMAMILTLAGMTLGATAALAKGNGKGGNGSGGSSNSGGSFKSFSSRSLSRNLSSKNVQGIGNSSSNSQGTKSFKLHNAKVLKPQGQQNQHLNNQGMKLQKLGGHNFSQNAGQVNGVIKTMPKPLLGNNVIQKTPKVLDPSLINKKGGKMIDPGFGLGKGLGGKVIDPGIGNGKGGKGLGGKVFDNGFGNGQKANAAFHKGFAKNKCFNKFCWPWWGFGCSPNYNWCYDPCWYGGGYNGCYGGGVIVVEKPVVVAQPVNVEQNVAVQQPAEEAAVQQAAAVEPADAAANVEAAAANLPKVPVGATITLRGEAFGDEAGKVAMQVGEVLLPATVAKWEANAVTITLPQIGLAAAAKGKFLILKADGELANEIPFELVPPQAPAVSQQ